MANDILVTPGAGDRVSAEDVSTLNGAAITAAKMQRQLLAKRTGAGIAVDLSSSTASVTLVAQTTSSIQLKAANNARVAIIILNDSGADMLLKYGATAADNDFSIRLGPGDIHREEIYTGRFDAKWSGAGSGNARITELLT